MLITALGLALVVATAVALAWPLLSAPPEEPAPAEADPTAGLEREKEAVLAAIREADFDHETGKLSEEDYRVLRAELEERAVGTLAALDRAASPSAPGPAAATAAPSAAPTALRPPVYCPGCGQKRRSQTEFCARCGHRFAPGGTGERRRRRA